MVVPTAKALAGNCLVMSYTSLQDAISYFNRVKDTLPVREAGNTKVPRDVQAVVDANEELMDPTMVDVPS
jgi:hypothetical protein